MTARAIWKGELKLDSTKVPVKLYSAVKDQTVRFHILDQKSKTRVKQHMVAPAGKEVTSEEVRKGFEVETGTFVILEKEDLEKLTPEESREIEITQFVPPAEIPPEYYDRPYYLGPDGDQTAYFALAEALKNQEKEGRGPLGHAQTALRGRVTRGRRSPLVVYTASCGRSSVGEGSAASGRTSTGQERINHGQTAGRNAQGRIRSEGLPG
jgi:Ku protein